MHFSAPSRRVLGVSAAGAIAVSTTLFAVGGVAQAAGAWTFSTDTLTPTAPGVYEVTVPDGICGIDWTLVGGQGGSDQNGAAGAVGGEYEVTTVAQEGQVISLHRGGAGQAFASGAAGGTNASDLLNGNGTAGTGSGGGGGALTLVYSVAGGYALYAYGGDGAGVGGGSGGGDDQNAGDWLSGSVTCVGHDGAARTRTGNGLVTGTGIPCQAAPTPPAPAPEVDQPGTPVVKWIEGGEKSATMQIWAGYVPDGSSTPVYQYSLDGGAWKKLVASSEFQVTPTITGLVNGRTYSVRVRVTVDGVSSEPTAAQEVTPRHVIGAPTGATVTTGPGSLTISWAPPADPTGVTGYSVWAIPGADPQSNSGQLNCPRLDAAARSCTIGVPVGTEYSVGIVALDAGSRGDAAWLVSGKVNAAAAPSTLPKSSGALSTDKGAVSTVTSGGTVTLTGGGYLPFSTVTVVMFSDPVVLGTTTADAYGTISVTVSLPAGVTGEHDLVASGVDPSGKPHNLTMAVTVAAGPGLPDTGSDIALPALGGLAALAAGAGLLVAARRRAA